MTSSTPDRYTFDLRTQHPNVDLDTLRSNVVAAIDDLADTVALLAQTQAGVDDGYFLTDLLFELVGQALTVATEAAANRAEIDALTERVAALENPPPCGG